MTWLDLVAVHFLNRLRPSLRHEASSSSFKTPALTHATTQVPAHVHSIMSAASRLRLLDMVKVSQASQVIVPIYSFHTTSTYLELKSLNCKPQTLDPKLQALSPNTLMSLIPGIWRLCRRFRGAASSSSRSKNYALGLPEPRMYVDQ